MPLDIRPNIPRPDFSGVQSPFAVGLQSLESGLGQGMNTLTAIDQLRMKRQQMLMQMAAQKRLSEMYPEYAPLLQSIPPEHMAIAAAALIRRNTGLGTPSKPAGSYWLNPSDPTDISLMPKEGYVEIKTSSADVGNKAINIALSKQRTESIRLRSDAWERSIDAKQINQLVKGIGLTGRQQSLLQQTNLRGMRGKEILRRPNITYQELALGEIDLAGIMQGGVPHVDEVKATHFRGWMEDWARIKTYATNHPQEIVPQEIKTKVGNLIDGVIRIDNTILEQNAKFQKDMLEKTIRGGVGPYEKTIDEMTRTLTTPPTSFFDTPPEEIFTEKDRQRLEYLTKKKAAEEADKKRGQQRKTP